MNVAAMTKKLSEIPFLPLRENINLSPGPRQTDGSPSWTLHDPIQGSFYRISKTEFEILVRWHIADPKLICDEISALGIAIEQENIEEMKKFIIASQLAAPSGWGNAKRLLRRFKLKKAAKNMWMPQSYFFFRIPIFRPDRFLNYTLPYVRWAFHPITHKTILILTIISIFLAARQWDHFKATFLHFFTLEGLFFYLLATILVKIGHELGHSFTAKYYGLNVPVIGLFFMIFMPLFYTDTSQAWLLSRRRPRLHIAMAGVMVELAFAGIALLLWSFLPDGPIRSAAYFIAAVSWISTLVTNISPFMRFDGYYILADASGIDNFRTRSFNIGKWRLREWLFGFNEPSPEKQLSKKAQAWMTLYAWAAWVYLFFLFAGIAGIIYAKVFKVLGIFIFVAQIFTFFWLPFQKEALVWWKMRKKINFNKRIVFTCTALITSIILIIIPWRTTINIPSLLTYEKYLTLYAPYSGKISKIHVIDKSIVKSGDLLFSIESTDLEYERTQINIKIKLLKWQLDQRQVYFDFLKDTDLIRSNLAAAITEKQTLQKALERMKIKAPFDGVFYHAALPVQKGLWVQKQTMLGYVANDKKFIVTGFIKEQNLPSININSPGKFYSKDTILKPLPMLLTKINDRNHTEELMYPHLSSLYGGTIPVRMQAEKLIPEQAIYQVNFKPINQNTISDVRPFHRGIVKLKAKRESLIKRGFANIASVFIRESGF